MTSSCRRWGILIGGVDFLRSVPQPVQQESQHPGEAKAANLPVIAYGSFITNVIDFIIMAFVIFCLISLLNRFKKEEPKAEPTLCPFCKMPVDPEATRCPHCTSEIPKK